MKKIIVLALALVFAFSGTALAEQIVTRENLKEWNRDNVAGGEGTLYGKFFCTRHDALPEHAIKEIGWMTLKPGASIGMHKHDNNEDAYIIVSGEGLFTDSDGKEYPVKGGDVTIARKGESHALKNTGTTDLIFLDVIGQQ